MGNLRFADICGGCITAGGTARACLINGKTGKMSIDKNALVCYNDLKLIKKGVSSMLNMMDIGYDAGIFCLRLTPVFDFR